MYPIRPSDTPRGTRGEIPSDWTFDRQDDDSGDSWIVCDRDDAPAGGFVRVKVWENPQRFAARFGGRFVVTTQRSMLGLDTTPTYTGDDWADVVAEVARLRRIAGRA